jgi:hypothetical protein
VERALQQKVIRRSQPGADAASELTNVTSNIAGSTAKKHPQASPGPKLPCTRKEEFKIEL